MSGNDLKNLLQSIPSTTVALAGTVGVIFLGFLFVKYNVAILRVFANFTKWLNDKLSKSVGVYMRTQNRKFKRTAELNTNSIAHSIYKYFDEILVNTGLHRSGVTVLGLISFIMFASIICMLVLAIAARLGVLLSVLALVAFFFLFMIGFRYVSLTRVEKNEEVIMDAIDLLVSDVKGGIFNSIIKYKDSFHDSVRPFFIECIDNVQNKGYSFEAAMEILSDQLGYSFADFAAKAIYYEANRQEGTEEIFGAIIEMNRQRRILRRENAEAFNTIKIGLLISFLAIGVFAVGTVLTEPAMRQIILETAFGRLMLIADVMLIAFVFSRLTAIRSKMI